MINNAIVNLPKSRCVINWIWLRGALLFVVVFTLGIGSGIFIAKKNLSLVSRAGETVRLIKHRLFPILEEPTLPILMPPSQVKKLLSFHSSADVSSGRKLLRQQFHGARCLYDSTVTHISHIANIEDKKLSPTHGESISINLPHGFKAHAKYFKSEIPSRILLIYNMGHGGQTNSDTENLANLLKFGIDVIAIDMPLIGQNNQPIITIPKIGTIRISRHDQLTLLETVDFNPMMLFVEPIACLVNYFSTIKKYSKIVQIGMSGGGNVATLNAAIDSRISMTYSISGQIPVFLRSSNPTTDWGDYEQINTGIFKYFSDLDIYAMAAHGLGRTYIQIFNEFDPCCYSGRGHESYSTIVEKHLQSIDSGKFGVWKDSDNFSHTVSRQMLTRILHALMIDV